jgi:hypothetical protein
VGNELKLQNFRSKFEAEKVGIQQSFQTILKQVTVRAIGAELN